MQITLNWDSSVSGAPSGFKAAVQAAANVFDAQIQNNIAVTLSVGWGEDGGSPIGSSALATGGPNNLFSCSYSQLTAALVQQANADGCPNMVANLPAADPTQGLGTWTVSQAQAKVLGLENSAPTATDGSIGFSNASTVSWSFNPQSLGANQYDFVSAALHEISHALGRVNLAGYGQYSPINLYTYASAGNLQLGASAPAYFSVDGGNTNLNNFDMSAGGDPADWSTTLTDSFGGGMAGVGSPMSATDWLVMESLGYKIAPTYILAGPNLVEQGAHDYVELSTVNVAANTVLAYTISGLSASQLDSGSLSGTVTVGQDGTALIDLGVSSNAHLSAPVQATVALANGQASYTVTVGNAGNTVFQFPWSGMTFATTTANDTFYGTASDAVSYDGNFSDYLVTVVSPGTIQVQDPVPGRDGTDTLIGPERLQFQDVNMAFDLAPTQSGGETAEMLGAAFGTASLANASYVGAGLSLFDSGYSMTQVAQLVINTGLVSAPDDTSFVKAVWFNLFGTAIDSADLATYTQLLLSHAMSQAGLLALAAETTLNQSHIGLASLASHGLPYI